MAEEIVLNEDYWDCECDRRYIHKKSCPECPYCGAQQEEQPDSRQEEIDNELNLADCCDTGEDHCHK